jgi:ABC-type nitrate/sulfonate/bicarbonate transport system permease component
VGPRPESSSAAVGIALGRRWSPEDHPAQLRIASVAALLVVWEVFGRRADPLLFTYPSAVGRAGLDLLRSGELLRQLPQSLGVLGAGLGVSVVLGVTMGLVAGRSRLLEAALAPHVNALSAMPPVALIPLLMLWFGLGFGVKVATVFLFAFPPVLVNASTGARGVSGSILDVGRVAGASRWQLLLKIVLPASLPFILTGVRLAVGRALVGMIIGELLTALTGLGAMLMLYANIFETAYLFAVVLLVAALGVGLSQVAQLVEARLTGWKATERAIR